MIDDIEARFRIDGPFTAADTIAAAEVAAHALRYLVHATLPGRAGDALPDPSDAYQVVGTMGSVTTRLPHLLGNLALRLEAMAEDPDLAADNQHRVPAGGAEELAHAVASNLRQAAQLVDQTAGAMRRAHRFAGRLKLDPVDQAGPT